MLVLLELYFPFDRSTAKILNTVLGYLSKVSGRSRISQKGVCARLLSGSVFHKLHENEINWTEKGVRVPGALLGSANESGIYETMCICFDFGTQIF